MVRASRARHASPTRPARTSSRTREGRVIYVGQGQEPAQPAVQLLRAAGDAARAHPPDGAAADTRRVDRGRATRSRRSSSSTTSSSGTGPASTSGSRTTSRTRSSRSRSTRSGRGRWSCGAPSARASGTSGPTPTPTRSARRSTCCCGRSRSARARTTSSTATTAWGARASTPTSRSARRRASAPSTTRSTTHLVEELVDVPRRRARRRSSTGSTSRCTRRPTRSSSSGRPGCATSSRRCARRSSASRWSAPKEEDFDVIGSSRTSSRRRSQVFLVRRGRVVGRKGLVVDKVEDVDTPALVVPRPRAALRRRAPPTTCRKEVLVPVEPADLELYEEFLALDRGLEGARPRARSAGRKRELLDDGHPQRARRRSRGTSSSGRPTTTRAPGRCSRSRRRSSCPRRRCGSSASTSRTSRAPRSSARWS